MKSQSEINSVMREHYLKMSEIYSRQKNAFRKLFDSGIEIDYTKQQIINLIYEGIPSMYRPKIWPVLLENIHGMTPKFYEMLLQKASVYLELKPNDILPQRSRILTHLKSIENDIERTYPQLKLFRKDNQSGQCLFNILSAWIVFREDVGYLQGMSHIAGLLLIQLKEYEAFVMFCSILTNDVLFLYETLNLEGIQNFELSFEKRLKNGDEAFYTQLKSGRVETRSFLLGWIITLFTRTMSTDMVLNLWDILLVYNLSPQILIETSYILLSTLKLRLNSKFQVDDMQSMLRNFKLSDVEAYNLLKKLKEAFR